MYIQKFSELVLLHPSFSQCTKSVAWFTVFGPHQSQSTDDTMTGYDFTPVSGDATSETGIFYSVVIRPDEVAALSPSWLSKLGERDPTGKTNGGTF